MKSNAQILSDRQAFVDAFLRAREILGRIDGVVNVGFGHKETAGEFTSQLAITVFVREKKPTEALSPADRVPAAFEDYQTDVRVVPVAQLIACDDETHYPQIQGGIQIEPKASRPAPGTVVERGTLGCIVKRRGNNDHDNVFLLSCEHVLRSNGAREKDYVYHPRAPSQSGGDTGESLGAIQDGAIADHRMSTVPGATPGSPLTARFYLDAAIARINIDSKCWGSTCTKDVIDVRQTQVLELGVLTDVRSVATDPSIMLAVPEPPAPDVIDGAADTVPRVFKVGRTTGKTTGIVRNVLGSALLPKSPGVFEVLENLIEIDYGPTSTEPALNCKGHKSFVEKGDSGAVVVDATNRVIGLMFLRNSNPVDGDPLRFRSFGCHILPVLDALGVCIPTTPGTSYGTAGALDGSGTTPSKKPRVALGEGTVLLSGDGVVESRTARAALPEPVVLTDEQRDHMLALRDALRETPQGRELHFTFGEVRREIGFLIRSCRPVKVVWHRNHGPAFLAHALNHLRGDTTTIPREVNGVPRALMLQRMGDALYAHGSNPLRDAIERYGPYLMTFADAETVDECLASLARSETITDVPA